MSRSGFSYQNYLLNDLAHKQRKKSKINIFTTATSITKQQIEWIEKNLQKDNNILVFAGDAGRIAEGGFEKNIKRLTGMSIKSRPDINVSYKFSLDKFSDPLAPGIPNTTLWMNNFKGPMFYVDDEKATALALISGTTIPGIAVKRHKDWTAIYIGGSLERYVTPRLIQGIAEEAGIKPVGPRGDITYFGNGFIVIHATTPGLKKLQWTGKADLIDIASNKTVIEKAESFSCNMKFGETRWFRLNQKY